MTDLSESDQLPCVDKLAFDTKKQADVAANVANYQHGTVVHPYKCRHCHLWHLASGLSE